MDHPRWLSLLVTLAACSPGTRDAEAVGRAVEAFGPGYYIGSVVVDPATYHYVTPNELLTTAEGAGPRTLDITVAASVSPTITFTGTRSPAHTELSAALGWDVSKSIELTADTSVLVPVNAYARIEAYPTYQKSTWTMVGFGQVPVGYGTTYKPVGVYFATCGCIGPDPCGTGCVNGFPWGGGASSSGTNDGPIVVDEADGGTGDADAGTDGG